MPAKLDLQGCCFVLQGFFFNLVGLEEKEIGVQCSMLAKLKLDLQGFQNLLGLGLERRRMNMQRWVEVGYSLQQG
tara:strand:- start:1164 stop:1388 length:225 start_codon:yes stop_codon:yes gene_type:complete